MQKPMSKSVLIFKEPELEFRYGQKVQDPRDGLGLFGPFDADDNATRPASLNYVVIGTKEAIEQFSIWSQMLNQPSLSLQKNNERLWVPFPGFEAAFNTPWPEHPIQAFQIDRESLLRASIIKDPYKRAYEVAEHYLRELRTASKLDEKIGVAVCIVPEEVWKNCRPNSYVFEGSGETVTAKEIRIRKTGQTDLFQSFDPEQYQFSTDFRRHLKARAMEFGIPLQIIRETTLRISDENARGQRGLTPLSDRMWNMATTLYYKNGGKPWRLVTAREGVCYIGLAFRKAEPSTHGTTACCAAQMFLNTGDGVVFLGSFGPWYSPKTEQFHLTKAAARDLLQGVLKTYEELHGKKLTEVFLHSRSHISKEEFEGYLEGCPQGVKLVGVRVRKDDSPRLYRIGKMPVLRGTFMKVNDRSGYLWGSGFKPRLETYDGWETPVPMRIDIQYGDATIERVAQDILGLTKLNYNACHLGDNQPVTVGFSDAVGEILISNPKITNRRPNFKFYI
ncbi:MAG TPA: hypothetical protein VGQ87_03405 [Patescibacteria group bacterium]|jgi:hypothetical protein|nr:hypothetical protein [Patescibacteria group bacterium]